MQIRTKWLIILKHFFYKHCVRDLTRDGRWGTYDVSVRKKMGGGGGICVETGYPLKLPSATNLARLGHFPPASQAGRLAGRVFYVYVFSLVLHMSQEFILTLVALTWKLVRHIHCV
jgi:hypothetical protein